MFNWAKKFTRSHQKEDDKQTDSDREPSPEKRQSPEKKLNAEKKTPTNFARKLASFRKRSPDKAKSKSRSPEKKSRSESGSPESSRKASTPPPPPTAPHPVPLDTTEEQQTGSDSCRLSIPDEHSENDIKHDSVSKTEQSEVSKANGVQIHITDTTSESSEAPERSEPPEKSITPDKCPTPEQRHNPGLFASPEIQAILEKLPGSVGSKESESTMNKKEMDITEKTEQYSDQEQSHTLGNGYLGHTDISEKRTESNSDKISDHESKVSLNNDVNENVISKTETINKVLELDREISVESSTITTTTTTTTTDDIGKDAGDATEESKVLERNGTGHEYSGSPSTEELVKEKPILDYPSSGDQKSELAEGPQPPAGGEEGPDESRGREEPQSHDLGDQRKGNEDSVPPPQPVHDSPEAAEELSPVSLVNGLSKDDDELPPLFISEPPSSDEELSPTPVSDQPAVKAEEPLPIPISHPRADEDGNLPTTTQGDPTEDEEPPPIPLSDPPEEDEKPPPTPLSDPPEEDEKPPPTPLSDPPEEDEKPPPTPLSDPPEEDEKPPPTPLSDPSEEDEKPPPTPLSDPPDDDEKPPPTPLSDPPEDDEKPPPIPLSNPPEDDEKLPHILLSNPPEDHQEPPPCLIENEPPEAEVTQFPPVCDQSEGKELLLLRAPRASPEKDEDLSDSPPEDTQDPSVQNRPPELHVECQAITKIEVVVEPPSGEIHSSSCKISPHTHSTNTEPQACLARTERKDGSPSISLEGSIHTSSMTTSSDSNTSSAHVVPPTPVRRTSRAGISSTRKTSEPSLMSTSFEAADKPREQKSFSGSSGSVGSSSAVGGSLPASPSVPRRTRRPHPVPAARSLQTLAKESSSAPTINISNSTSVATADLIQDISSHPGKDAESSREDRDPEVNSPFQNSETKPEVEIPIPKPRKIVSLNPFDSDDDDEEDQSQKPCPVPKPRQHISLNPFGSDSEDENEINTSTEARKTSTPRQEPVVIGLNPFDEDDDEEMEVERPGWKMSQSSGEFRLMQSSSPAPYSPSSSRSSLSQKRLYDSSASINSQSSRAGNETVSTNPFDEDDDDDECEMSNGTPLSREPVRMSLAVRNMSPLQRDKARASLPSSARMKMGKKKRQAPLPPGYKPPPPGTSDHLQDYDTRSLSMGGSTVSLNQTSPRKISTGSLSSLSSPKKPPPRPPPPKTRSYTVGHN